MHKALQIHASLFEISRDVLVEFQAELGELDEVEYDGRVLKFWHECNYMDAEALFKRLAESAGDAAHGGLDVVDREAWNITRYELEQGTVTSTTIPLNEVLDAKANEWGA
jgi:hypothetical protein